MLWIYHNIDLPSLRPIFIAERTVDHMSRLGVFTKSLRTVTPLTQLRRTRLTVVYKEILDILPPFIRTDLLYALHRLAEAFNRYKRTKYYRQEAMS